MSVASKWPTHHQLDPYSFRSTAILLLLAHSISCSVQKPTLGRSEALDWISDPWTNTRIAFRIAFYFQPNPGRGTCNEFLMGLVCGWLGTRVDNDWEYFFFLFRRWWVNIRLDSLVVWDSRDSWNVRSTTFCAYEFGTRLIAEQSKSSVVSIQIDSWFVFAMHVCVYVFYSSSERICVHHCIEMRKYPNNEEFHYHARMTSLV